jgi:hypothetical protein
MPTLEEHRDFMRRQMDGRMNELLAFEKVKKWAVEGGTLGDVLAKLEQEQADIMRSMEAKIEVVETATGRTLTV